MSYENPQIPEGINYSTEHPLKDFAWLLVTVLGATAVMVALLFVLAGYLVRFIPFSTEATLAQPFTSEFTQQAEPGPTQHYLQSLANQLAAAEQLPQGMTITVHYIDDDVVNAFAGLGGHIYLHRGLLAKLPHENALAMVIAHEIAHIKNRDPIVASGRMLTVVVALSCLVGLGDSDLAQGMVTQATSLTALAFSRHQEQRADDDAASALLSHYGHLSGASALFETLQQEAGLELPAFFSSHPGTQQRLGHLAELAQYQSGATVPLPTFFPGQSPSD
ncbi:M48 family metallopeptidase [Halioxenophilus sp. WMMB6]|uniref:M48 family metallopeptidase n=1 Tax=Halioxenophilus sp. WMMB6 TaxID=3073815 RepID=UPI00295F4D58|nr:M48 family metallopeptidase [Halioxenophilus sp. WMMB6]